MNGRMTRRMDLVAFGRNDEPVLFVEVRRKLGATSEWASRLRQNMLSDDTLAAASFFLIALPDRFFLWQEKGDDEPREPDFVIDARPILGPYFSRAGISVDDIYEDAFALLVASWLGDLLRAENPAELLAGDSCDWLVDSGLFAALAGGHFEHGVAV